MLDPERDVRPRIVGDFNFGGIDYIVVFWPEKIYYEQEPNGDLLEIDRDEEDFQVYRTDVPWRWFPEAVDMRSGATRTS